MYENSYRGGDRQRFKEEWGKQKLAQNQNLFALGEKGNEELYLGMCEEDLRDTIVIFQVMS